MSFLQMNLPQSRRAERRRTFCASGDDAPMLAGEIGVTRDRSRRCEVPTALERKTQWAAGGGELVQADVAESQFTEAGIAATAGRLLCACVQLREDPGSVAVGGEDLHDWFEVDGAGFLVESGARFQRGTFTGTA
jgi:hypothetical protein